MRKIMKSELNIIKTWPSSELYIHFHPQQFDYECVSYICINDKK